MTIESVELKKDGRPIYRQIASAIEEMVQQQQLLPGARLPTHRALADSLSVTVGTVTRAYAEAERRGIVESKVGSGTFICRKDRPAWSFSHRTRQDEMNFGYNVPPQLDRAELFTQAVQQIASHPAELNELMLYQPPSGVVQHRAVLADWLQQHGVSANVDRLLYCSGAQNAIQLCLTTLCRQGDTVLVDKLTYPGLLSLARQLHITVKPVEMDEQGMIPEALVAACKQYSARMVYMMPTLQNPTTVTMGEARRRELIAVCRRQQLLILEDDVNGLLPRHRPEPLVNMAPEQVIYIGGLSKNLAPGLRLGFMLLPESLYSRIVHALQNHSWMISPLLTAIAAILLENGAANKVLESIREEMESRWSMVAEKLSAVELTFHPNGFHGWISLPDDWSLSEFMAASKTRGLELKSSELFVPPGYPAPSCVRIAVSAPTSTEELEQGCIQLADLLANPPSSAFSL